MVSKIHSKTLGNPSAAVLIPILNINDSPYLLLTVRSKKLKSHPGQVSFPGGKVDPEDENIQVTALRETEEEVGITRANISILSNFHDFSTPWIKCVTPIIAKIDSDLNYTMSTEEIDEILEVPIKDLLDPMILHTENWVRNGVSVNVRFFDWLDKKTNTTHNIWGATAEVIFNLLTDLGLIQHEVT